MNWKGKVVWITGASSGIGEELVYQLAAKGARIILSARSAEKLQEVYDRARLTTDSGRILTMDISLYHGLEEHIKEVIAYFGQIDVLINNAGVTQRSYAAQTDIGVDEQLMNINYFGVVALTKALLPHFIKNQSGIIAVTSSVAGKFGTPLRTAYCASKHALHGFFESLRAEVYDNGIQITLICPGFIKTDISENALMGDGSKHGKLDQSTGAGLSVEECVRQYIRAIEKGKEEVVISKAREKFGVLLSRLYPAQLRKMIRKVKIT